MDFWNGTLAQVQEFRSFTGVTYPLLLMAGAAGVGTSYSTSYDAFFVVDGDGIIRYRRASGALPRWRPEEIGPVVDAHIAALLTPAGDPPPRDAFRLGSAYPNPFNPATRIPYRLEEHPAGLRLVDLRIMDVRGRTVRTLVTEPQPAGRDYEALWDGLSDGGMPAASGTYLVNLTVGDQVQARFVTLLK